MNTQQTHHNAAQQVQQVQQLTLGGGCFWCLDAAFRQVKGILQVESGYCNGKTNNPTYADICTGTTGYVEVVRLQYDNKVIGVPTILEIFFALHDATQRNRQGNDVGTQYRSGIYVHNTADLLLVQRFVSSQPSNCTTEVNLLYNYTKAEDYHQDFFNKNPSQGYCLAMVKPKVTKIRLKFADLLV